MEEILRDEILKVLGTSPIPTLLGGMDKIFYRGAVRNTTSPYLCYNLQLFWAGGRGNYMKVGELIFDVWDYATVNDRTIAITRELNAIFKDCWVEAPGLKATRIWGEGDREAPVENNRSNRRSEDEHEFRREVSYYVRGWDLQAQMRAPQDGLTQGFFDDNKEIYSQKMAAPRLQPDGIRDLFQLPEAAYRILYYTLDGVQKTDFERQGPDYVRTLAVPASGTRLSVAYIPA